MIQLQNWINGVFSPPLSNEYLPSYNPATGEIEAQVPDSSELEVVQAIQAAQKAFLKWSELASEKRAEYLYRIADLIEARTEELALAESADQGKPLALARQMDIPRAAHNFRFFAGAELHRTEVASQMNDDAINYVLRQPIGVAGLVAPWNLPLYLLTWKIAPAIAVGNTCVAKPSELTSRTAMMLAQIMMDAELPPGVVNLVMGRGEPVGRMICQHPGVHLVSFTGGTQTGEKILDYTKSSFKKVSLELGGKNAAIVLKDANLKKVIPEVLRSSFLNQGEICLCSSRILVQEDIFEEFCTEFTEQAQTIQVGDPKDPNTFMGPLVSEQHLAKVLTAVEQIKKDEGKILCGGERLRLEGALSGGYFMSPTVVKDLTLCSEVHQTEIFGPVVTINSFKYPFDAVKLANTSPYGLSASVWTENITRAHKLAQGLQAGTVWINCWMKRDLRMPFGGLKASGIGREGGDASIDFFTESKTVCVGLSDRKPS